MPDTPEALANLPLMRHLTAEQRGELIRAGTRSSLAKGEILFHEDDPAETMFSVIEGRIKLVRYSPRGKEMLLHLVRQGQSFAEGALFGRGTYPATAVALARTSLWCLPRRSLMDLMRRSPELGMAMVASVSMWTRKLAAQLELLTQRRVEERLAVYLLANLGQRNLEPGELIRLTDAKNLIAAQCGTAPEVLSRTLRRLEEEGVIEGLREGVRVLDPERLRGLAEWIEDDENPGSK
jgi:CRP/FNR family transcriptional regulator